MSIRQSYFVSFFALLVVVALLPPPVQAWHVNLDISGGVYTALKNDLFTLSLSRSPDDNIGTITLSAVSGGSKIKGTEVSLPKTWDLTSESLPSTLHIECVAVSSSVGDIELKLRWENEIDSCEDSVKATVYELEGVFSPEDDFAGRSYDKYGLAEGIDLNFTTDPPGITASQIGGLKWKKISGTAGDFVPPPGDDGTGHFVCFLDEGSVTLKLEVLSGPSKGEGPTKQFDVIKPSAAYLIKEPGTEVGHIEDVFSVGFWGWAYLLPRDVSFDELQWSEGSCTADADGYLAEFDGDKHPEGDWFEIGPGNITNGCHVMNMHDKITIYYENQNWAKGDFKWYIPWRIGYCNQLIGTFCTVLQHAYSEDGSGTAYIKKGAGPFSKAVDALSSQEDLFQ